MTKDQGDWPDLVVDLTFQENRRPGNIWVIIQDLDEDESGTAYADVAYFANVRSWGPAGSTWDVEEIDSERIPTNEVYRRLNGEAWEVLSYPLGHLEWRA